MHPSICYYCCSSSCCCREYRAPVLPVRAPEAIPVHPVKEIKQQAATDHTFFHSSQQERRTMAHLTRDKWYKSNGGMFGCCMQEYFLTHPQLSLSSMGMRCPFRSSIQCCCVAQHTNHLLPPRRSILVPLSQPGKLRWGWPWNRPTRLFSLQGRLAPEAIHAQLLDCAFHLLFFRLGSESHVC